jgi:nucleotide-binding universal stress UspA family protein
MLEKVLVPLDGSELADRVLPVIRGLAAGSDVEVTLLHVIPDDPLRAAELVRSAARYLEQKRLALVDRIERVGFDIMTGDPADSIQTFATSYAPSLVALATHGRTGLSRLVHGSVTETLLRRAPFPILAVNPFCLGGLAAPRVLPLRNILVPLDGTKRSAAILPVVRALAGPGTTVTLLHVVEPVVAVPLDLALSSAGTGVLDRPPLVDASSFLEPHARELAASGIRVQTRAQLGMPASAICEVASEVGADVVAMATHGRTGLARLFFGSCCEDVLHLSGCPVLAIKAETPALV